MARRLYASGDSMREAAFGEFFDARAEIVPPPEYPDTEARYRGAEGFLRFQLQLDDVWRDWRVEAEDFIDAGDQVVVFVRVSGTAKQSEAPVAISTAHLLTVANRRVARVEIFLDRSQALAAAGLARQ